MTKKIKGVQENLFEQIKDFFVNRIFTSRLRVLMSVMVIFSSILIIRLFVLQIVRGADYQANYDLTVEKDETIPATRGNIYDRNGKLLAYNELAYAITIEDSGSYNTKKERNEKMNADIAEIITHIEANGDNIDNNFGIIRSSSGQYEFVASAGTALQRFRADVFGHASIDDLTYNDKLKLDEASATPDQIMDYLMGDTRYDISDKYDAEMRYKICIVRYNIGQNSYQKYIATTIASNVSDESVAYIKENSNELTGVDIKETSIRKYVDSEYFAHIIGYTGTISTDEYNEKKKEDESVELTDVVGKSGMEQVMNDYLSGTKGQQKLYVDSVGNLIQVSDYKEPVSGDDVYLSIDKDLQEATYRSLEKEIASIVYSKIANIKTFHTTGEESDIMIPVYDVYYSFINNNLIDTAHFSDADATDTERAVKSAYDRKEADVLAQLRSQLASTSGTVYKDLPEEYQDYDTFIVTYLKKKGVFDKNAIDASDEMQTKWTSEALSVNEYLLYAIENNWIDITTYAKETKYVDTDELYARLIDYVIEQLKTDSSFEKLVYKYVLQQDMISGNQLCALLYEQGVLPADDATHDALLSGGISAYSFVLDKIKNLEITPGQLGLDPCSGSAVVIDPKTGETLACVSYPGYDNNKLANSVDSSYYSYLTTSQSEPLYNHATQQKTAPGSTYKIVSATAGLAENVITTSTQILDLGKFEKVSNKPECWIYPRGTHGSINVAEALRHSCNYFFYEVGYDLAGGNSYNDATGIEKLSKYASMYGLDSKTGVEIEESKPTPATEFPVMAAIGQSDNNFTTISLARYVTAVANRGTVYNLTLLDHVEDPARGNTVATYEPSVKNQITALSSDEWNTLNSGLRMVVEDLSAFSNTQVQAAGKTGTAQESLLRPNHALFVGYAPYTDPQIAVATRIAHGYGSSNASVVAAEIMSYYFGEKTLENISENGANAQTTTNSVTD